VIDEDGGAEGTAPNLLHDLVLIHPGLHHASRNPQLR
jgi:hypothetical protein